MTNRYSKSYEGNGSDNNTSENYDSPGLKMSSHTAVEIDEVTGLGEYTHDEYGQSLIVDLGGVSVLDGILMERTDDEKFKIFSPEDLGLERAMIESEDDVQTRHSTSAGKSTYTYELVGVALENAEGELGEPIEFGNATMFLPSGSKGRTMVERLAESGEEARSQNENWNSTHNWLATSDPQLRTELEGRPVELFFKVEEYTNRDGDEKSFTKAVIIDQETGEPVAPIAASEGGQESGTGNQEPEHDSGIAPEDETEEVELPRGVEPLRDIFVSRAEKNGVPEEEEIREVIKSNFRDPEERDELLDYTGEIQNQVREKVA